jgi:hypothetical protein
LVPKLAGWHQTTEDQTEFETGAAGNTPASSPTPATGVAGDVLASSPTSESSESSIEMARKREFSAILSEYPYLSVVQ